ncbi:hypothetical protein [Arthrobacter sp. SLBN-100]|uniref:hypothetical protein n=1 Tax=Arthrobacter sp. SLBN-100 TaxID=2768450 RepID=UPI001152888A|nr:hypothetical protein [Arthrobacter sp. SLBN-100]
MKNSHIEALSAFNESLVPLFESDVCRMVETLDNIAYGTVFGTADRKNAPSLAGVKFRDPEAGAILAAGFTKRAREAGLEAASSAVSRSVYLAQGGR